MSNITSRLRMADDYKTRQTLIQRACDGEDGQAWDEFISYYEQFIYILLLHFNVPEQECDDIAQKVKVTLWKSISTFDSKRAKFRTWLITIIRNTTGRHMKQLYRSHERYIQSESLIEMLCDDASSEFEKVYQKEWENYITSLAMNNIKECFSGKAIEVFNLYITGRSVQEIADSLEIHLNSVYNLKNRVKARLITEIKHLRNELEL